MPGKKGNVPSFLTKLYNMIDTCESNIASWTDNGSMFVIRDIQKFEQKVIPKFFHTIKFTSFTRQLCNYGFQKMQSAIKNAAFDPEIANTLHFYHCCFQRGKRDLLKEIKRTSNSKMVSSSSSESQTSSLPKDRNTVTVKDHTNLSSVDQQIIHLKDRIDALEQMVVRLKGIIESRYQCDVSIDALMIQEKKEDDLHIEARCSSAKIQHVPCDHGSDSQPLPYQLDSGSLQQSLHSTESTELRYISSFSDEHQRSQTSSVSMFTSNSSCYSSCIKSSPSTRRKVMDMSPGKTLCMATSNRASSRYFPHDNLPLVSGSDNTLSSSELMTKPTLPPHPKSKDHLPHDITHFAMNNTERVSSFNSLATVELSRSFFDEVSIPSDHVVPPERDLSFSSYLSKMTL